VGGGRRPLTATWSVEAHLLAEASGYQVRRRAYLLVMWGPRGQSQLTTQDLPTNSKALDGSNYNPYWIFALILPVWQHHNRPKRSGGASIEDRSFRMLPERNLLLHGVHYARRTEQVLHEKLDLLRSISFHDWPGSACGRGGHDIAGAIGRGVLRSRVGCECDDHDSHRSATCHLSHCIFVVSKLFLDV